MTKTGDTAQTVEKRQAGFEVLQTELQDENVLRSKSKISDIQEGKKTLKVASSGNICSTIAMSRFAV
jgi:hypothetical protein